MKIKSEDLIYDAWGRGKLVTDYSLFSGLFTYDIPDTQWKIQENGAWKLTTGASVYASSVGGALNVTTGSVVGNSTIVQSKRHPRYQPNRGHLYSSSVIIEDPTTGVYEFGLFTESNGVYFRVVDNKLYLVRKSNGVEVGVREAKLDTDMNGVRNIDLSKGCVYGIQFQWRGVGNYYFYANQQLVGSFLVLNTLEELSIANPALPIAYRCENTDGSLPVLKSGCVDVTSEGGAPQSQQLRTVIGNSVAFTDEVMLAVMVNGVFNGSYNTRDVAILRTNIDVSKKCNIETYVTRDVTALTGGSWVSDGASNLSVLKPATSGTISLGLAKVKLVDSLPCVSGVLNYRDNPNPKRVDNYITNGDIVIYRVKGSAVTAQVVVELGEEV